MCPACLQFLCNMLFSVILLMKTDSTVICVPCMLEHVYYEPFSLKIADLEDILCQLVEFVYCLKFTPLKSDSSK